MDVERIQKINSLALDLMKQGLATDREDAIVQAEKVFRNKDSESYSSIRDTMKEIQKDARPESNKPGQENAAKDDLSQEKIKDILEQNTKYIVGKLKEFQQKMEAMENEVSMLKNKVTLAGSTARELADRPRPKETTEENKAKPESHPRSGNYTEQDVSIEKFFYTGHK